MKASIAFVGLGNMGSKMLSNMKSNGGFELAWV